MATEKIDHKYAVALSYGTAALHFAIKLCGKKLYGQPEVGHGALEGRKVFWPNLTFDDTVNSVAMKVVKQYSSIRNTTPGIWIWLRWKKLLKSIRKYS